MQSRWLSVGAFVCGASTALAEDVTFDFSCEPDNNWHACCEISQGLFENNWDFGPNSGDCPPFPGENSNVIIQQACVLDGRIGGPITIASLTGGGDFTHSQNLLNVTGSATFGNYTLITSGLTVGGDFRVGNEFQWRGGTLTLASTGEVSNLLSLATGGSKTILGGTLISPNTVNWTGGTFAISSEATFESRETFSIRTNALLTGSGTFINEGALTKLESPGNTIFENDLAYLNRGSTNVQTGTLTIRARGESTGPFTVGDGALIEFRQFGSSVFSLAGGTSFSGSGLVRCGGGDLMIAPSVAVPCNRFRMDGGDVALGLSAFFDIDSLEWTGGTFSGPGTITAQSSLDITTAGTHIVDGGNHFISLGTGNWIDTGELRIVNGATFENQGQFSIGDQVRGISFDQAGGGRIVNAAAATFNAGSTTFGLGLTKGSVENHGTINFLSSVPSIFENSAKFGNLVGGVANCNDLELKGGGENASTINIMGSHSLQLTGGTFSLANESRIHGPGTLKVSGVGHLEAASGAATVERLSLEGGIISGVGDLLIESQFDWTDGLMAGSNGAGKTVLAGGASGSIHGTRSKTVQGRTLENKGMLAATGFSNLNFTDGASLTNTGVFDLGEFVSLRRIGDDPNSRIVNSGVFQRSTGDPETHEIDIPFDNSGTTRVLSASTLRFAKGGTSTGAFEVQQPRVSKIEFFDGVMTLNPGTELRGEGDILMTGGTILVNAPVFCEARLIIDDTVVVAGPGALTALTDAAWFEGSMKGTGPNGGSTIFLGGMVLFGGGDRASDGRPVTNLSAEAIWESGDFNFTSGAVFDNAAPFDARHAALTRFNGEPGTRFLNRSDFEKSDIGSTSMNVAFENQGAIRCRDGRLLFSKEFVQTTGSLERSEGGVIEFTQPTNITGGVIRGNSQPDELVFAHLNNTGGRISAGTSAGLLTVTGDVTQGPDAFVEIELGGLLPETEHDVFAVTGHLELDGTLEVKLIDDFRPNLGDRFTIMTFGSRNGEFAKVVAPQLRNPKWKFEVEYKDNAIDLVVTPGLTSNSDPTFVPPGG